MIKKRLLEEEIWSEDELLLLMMLTPIFKGFSLQGPPKSSHYLSPYAAFKEAPYDGRFLMGSFVSGWTVINIVSEHGTACNGPNVVHWLHFISLCSIFYSNDTQIILIILKTEFKKK